MRYVRAHPDRIYLKNAKRTDEKIIRRLTDDLLAFVEAVVSKAEQPLQDQQPPPEGDDRAAVLRRSDSRSPR